LPQLPQIVHLHAETACTKSPEQIAEILGIRKLESLSYRVVLFV